MAGAQAALRAALIVAGLGAAAIVAGGPLSAAVGADSPPVGADSPPVAVDSPPVQVRDVECRVVQVGLLNVVTMTPSDGFAPRLVVRRDGGWLATLSPADYVGRAAYVDAVTAPGLHEYEVRYRITGERFDVSCGTVATPSPLRCIATTNLAQTEVKISLEWRSAEPRPTVQVRRNGDWLSTLSKGAGSNFIDDDGSAGDTYELRYRYDGVRVEAPCFNDTEELPRCSTTTLGTTTYTSVAWFADNEPRVYQLRRNGRWQATVDFARTARIADVDVPIGDASYSIRFRVDGTRFEVECGTVTIPTQ